MSDQTSDNPQDNSMEPQSDAPAIRTFSGSPTFVLENRAIPLHIPGLAEEGSIEAAPTGTQQDNGNASHEELPTQDEESSNEAASTGTYQGDYLNSNEFYEDLYNDNTFNDDIYNTDEYHDNASYGGASDEYPPPLEEYPVPENESDVAMEQPPNSPIGEGADDEASVDFDIYEVGDGSGTLLLPPSPSLPPLLGTSTGAQSALSVAGSSSTESNDSPPEPRREPVDLSPVTDLLPLIASDVARETGSGPSTEANLPLSHLPQADANRLGYYREQIAEIERALLALREMAPDENVGVTIRRDEFRLMWEHMYGPIELQREGAGRPSSASQWRQPGPRALRIFRHMFGFGTVPDNVENPPNTTSRPRSMSPSVRLNLRMNNSHPQVRLVNNPSTRPHAQPRDEIPVVRVRVRGPQAQHPPIGWHPIETPQVLRGIEDAHCGQCRLFQECRTGVVPIELFAMRQINPTIRPHDYRRFYYH